MKLTPHFSYSFLPNWRPHLPPMQPSFSLTSDPSSLREVDPSRTPTLTYILIALTTLIYVGQVAGQYLLGVDVLAAYGSKVNSSIMAGQYWRLITPVFLHGSILHIGFNMYALYILGPNMERFYGAWRYLLLYLLAGYAGNVFSFMFSTYPSLGSSTAIFGLLAAYGVFIYQNRLLFGDQAKRSLQNIIMVAVINFVIGLSPGIDNWGHLGGALGGTIFAVFAGPQVVRYVFPPTIRLYDRRSRETIIITAVAVFFFFSGLVLSRS